MGCHKTWSFRKSAETGRVRSCRKMTAFLVASFYLLFLPSLSSSATARQILDLLKENDSIVVADHSGRILLEKDADIKRIPASTLKILTVLAAFHFLGPDYRFITKFYTDDNANLKIRGYGDPLLISEVIEEISSVLARKISMCNSVIVDDSYFTNNSAIPGVSDSANPYDAPLSALSANFNTVFFKRNRKGEIVSAEPQTPIIPYLVDKIGKNYKGDRISLFGNQHEAAIYTGHLLLHFLKENGVVCEETVQCGTILPEDRLIYTYSAISTIREAAKGLFEFSNNFMANQIMLVLGAEVFGPPATLEKGRQAVLDYADTLGLSGIRVAEGSGISRQNRLSARDMLRILKEFEPCRRLLISRGLTYYKTGTLDGIQTRAGYMETDEGSSFFVIFLNTPGGDADRLLDLIAGKWGPPGR
ncbi:MAG: hypothetical protein BAW33_01150 [Desulfobacterales bacterium C00003104]|nr:MAG: hypothetical protein BAW33_01150 [Desulfobacterales bacterium C00003104]